MEVFAEQLQQLRRTAGMSQEDLAEKIDVSRQTLSKWEQGQSSPDLERVAKLCDVLHVSPNELIYGETKEHNECTFVHTAQKKGPEQWVWEIFWIAMFVCGNAVLIGSFYIMASSFVVILALGMIFGPIIIFSVKGILHIVRAIKTHKKHS